MNFIFKYNECKILFFQNLFYVYLMYINFNMYKAMYAAMFGIFFSGPVQVPKILHISFAIANMTYEAFNNIFLYKYNGGQNFPACIHFFINLYRKRTVKFILIHFTDITARNSFIEYQININIFNWKKSNCKKKCRFSKVSGHLGKLWKNYVIEIIIVISNIY